MAEQDNNPSTATPEDQARQQAGQQVSLRIDESDMKTGYANGFRANPTAEELMLDFGLNVMNPPAEQGANPTITFKVTDRIILNFYTAKRLAIALGQLVRRHEQQFGEMELDVSKRQVSGAPTNPPSTQA